MNTLVKQGWGADNPAFRQIFTSLLMPTANKDQADAFNELQRLSASPECAARYLETVGDLDSARTLVSGEGADAGHACSRRLSRSDQHSAAELAAGSTGCSVRALPGKNHVPARAGPGRAPVVRGAERLLEERILAAGRIAGGSIAEENADVMSAYSIPQLPQPEQAPMFPPSNA